ncbi:FIST signal transduction protein [Uliginosibacterium gangwonense]|uniref:FIST signal transduction protein n=1 Tax=Uliginosibacterium gangwonense TaxID=392736 RepID=UPI0003645309|nr:FIST N-terminal domain-containing protein [Uliginosibacterium gangwonense]
MQAFRTVQSCSPDAREAVREIHEGFAGTDLALLLFFCSSAYDLDTLAAEINQRFKGISVLGGTSAGSLGPLAYGQTQSLVGIGFPVQTCKVASAHMEGLQDFSTAQAQQMVNSLRQQLEKQVAPVNVSNTFAFQLIDGLSVREEVVTRLIQGALGPIPLVGGSVGDNLHFERAMVFVEGAFCRDTVAVLAVATALPFEIFMTQHFIPGEERLVVTEADEKHRIVREFNGLPAVEEYARCVGVSAGDVCASLFADRPVVVNIGNNHYVRSIQRVLPDKSLKFFCAIEEGVVLRVAHGADMVENLTQCFGQIRERIGAPLLILGCECVLRRLEVERHPFADVIQKLYRDNSVAGLCTFGEQYRGVHINQTLTGVAIGSLAEKVCDRTA